MMLVSIVLATCLPQVSHCHERSLASTNTIKQNIYLHEPFHQATGEKLIVAFQFWSAGCSRYALCLSCWQLTLGNKVEISKIKATVSADTESLVIYSGHGYMTYDNK